MNEQIYEFTLGNFRCWAIKDADAEATGHEAFPNASDEEIKAAAERFGFDFDGTIDQSYTVLLVDTGKDKILLDTGNGGTTGRLLSHLETLGVSRESITIVVISHLHGDHFAGALNSVGELNFPNAKHFIWREEWDFYCNPERLAREEKESPQHFAYKQKFLLPLAPHWHFLDAANPEVITGIKAIPAFGHSKHHVALRLESQGDVLFFTADAYIHPAYIENPHWTYKSDFDSEMSIATRKALAKQIADEKAMILGYHFAFPSLGRVVAEGDKFIWQE